MKHIFILIIVAFSLSAQAQVIHSSPFKHIPLPQQNGLMRATLSNEVTAYRFVLPFAGYSPVTKQMSTGIGYGWNRLHFVDSTQSYYTDLSVFVAAFANGDFTPSPYNAASFGIGVGFFNDLIIIVPAYNLPTPERKGGSFDLKISFGFMPK